MKRIITFLVIGLLFSCSVDDGLNQPEDQIDEKFVVTELNGCMADVLNLSAGGSLAVLNQENKIYLTVTANDGFELSKAYFQIEESTSDFPVENNGNLNPRKLEHSKSFTKGIGSHTFEVEWQEGVDAIIAMYVVFKQKAGPTLSGWTGDLPGSNGKWSYFEYLMCTPQAEPCGDLTAGKDNSKTITYGEAAAIGDWEGVKNHYLSLLEPGVPREGSFDPSIWDIIYAFNGAENPLGDYTTVYTITNGECTDSVELTITVVAD